MDSREILSVIENLEKGRGISRDLIIEAISSSIKSSAAKGVNAGQELKVEIDPKTGVLRTWVLLSVVDSVSDKLREIHISKAKQVSEDYQLGDIYEKEISPSDLGRISASAAKQAIMQRIRQFEKDKIYDEYKDQIGEIVNGTVRRRERGDLVIDLGKAEAILPRREQVPTEKYNPGEHIRCLMLGIDETPRGPEIILTRSSFRFVRKLFEIEVTEIADGTVSLCSVARDPGYRTKISVSTTDSKVDPVGACVGSRGARVKNIVRELSGEKIDVIKYEADPKAQLIEAIKPAVAYNIRIDSRDKKIRFEVSEQDLSIAIGKRGQNAKLTSKLMGWKLDIAKLEDSLPTIEKQVQRAVEQISNIEGITPDEAQALVSKGLTSLEAFDGVEAEDLVKVCFFTEDQAKNILECIRKSK